MALRPLKMRWWDLAYNLQQLGSCCPADALPDDKYDLRREALKAIFWLQLAIELQGMHKLLWPMSGAQNVFPCGQGQNFAPLTRIDFRVLLLLLSYAMEKLLSRVRED